MDKEQSKCTPGLLKPCFAKIFLSYCRSELSLNKSYSLKKAARHYIPFLLLVLFAFNYNFSSAQTITGAWKGRIKNTKVELKLVRSGDSLTGTSYYYESKSNFRRFMVKGYFDPLTNEVVWWDDQLINDKASGSFARISAPEALLSTADFNCPGEDEMFLDGHATLRDDKDADKRNVKLQKTGIPIFGDEWDFVIENYTVGANDPDIIDSISHIALRHTPAIEKKSLSSISEPVDVAVNKPSPANKPVIAKALTVEQKFVARKKALATVIPITADSIELRFYDNAEIDGDSIALFLNDALIFKNIRLTAAAHTVKLSASSLDTDNELVMVAENLGSIPPNTSLMVAIVGEKRYEARLQSTENSSALIRFIKPPSQQ